MNDLRKLRKETGLTADDVVAILREKYPKIDKTCISKAESGKYGLALSREAMRYLHAHIYGVPTQKEKRIKRHCVSVRLTDEEYALLQLYLTHTQQTAQEYFHQLWNGGDGP